MILLSVIDERRALAESDVWKISEVCFDKGVKYIVVKKVITVKNIAGFKAILVISIHVIPPANVTNISLFEKYLPKQIMMARNRAIGATSVTFSGSVKITNLTIASIPSPWE